MKPSHECLPSTRHVDRRATTRLLRSELVEAQAIIDNLDMAVAVLDTRFYIINVNHSFCSTFKCESADTIGNSFFALGNGQWDIAELKELLSDVITKAKVVVGFAVTKAFHQIGQRTIMVSARRIRGADRMEILMRFEDITERARVTAELQILYQEASHRARNELVVVHALANHILTKGKSATQYRQAFLNHLDALLAAQDLSQHFETDFADLIDRILKPIDSARVHRSSCPPAPICKEQLLPLTLIFHELMTNAFKYGALSTKKGFVSLTWTIDVQATGSILTVDWHEHGGPKVLPTSGEGFGSRLITYSLKELHATCERLLEPTGLQLTLRLPLEPEGLE